MSRVDGRMVDRLQMCGDERAGKRGRVATHPVQRGERKEGGGAGKR